VQKRVINMAEDEKRLEQSKMHTERIVAAMKDEVEVAKVSLRRCQFSLKTLIDQLTYKKLMLNPLEARAVCVQEELRRAQEQIPLHVEKARKAHSDSWNTELKLRRVQQAIARQELMELNSTPGPTNVQLIKDMESRTKYQTKLLKKRNLLKAKTAMVATQRGEYFQQRQLHAQILSSIQAANEDYVRHEKSISEKAEQIRGMEEQLSWKNHEIEQKLLVIVNLEEELIFCKLERLRRRKAQLMINANQQPNEKQHQQQQQPINEHSSESPVINFMVPVTRETS